MLAGGLADGAHHRQVVVDAEAELHLVRIESLAGVSLSFLREARGCALAMDAIEAGRVRLHARAEHAAEQTRDRLAACLAGDVPEGDVERADRADDRAFLSVVACVVIHAV